MTNYLCAKCKKTFTEKEAKKRKRKSSNPILIIMDTICPYCGNDSFINTNR
ncbi:MAG: hypothetical protein ACTSR3_07735 [Candidatus Helarchaeota archaeon]